MKLETHFNFLCAPYQKFKDEELPLKGFAKDEISLSPFKGYIQKAINYYKSTLKHSCVNVRASHLHELFIDELKIYEIKKHHVSKLEDQLADVLEQRVKSYRDEKDFLIKQKKEIESKLGAVEEKYIMGDIDREIFEKHGTRFKNILQEIQAKMIDPAQNSSNLKKAISVGVEIASNLSQLWISSDYDYKQKVQYMLFPEGLLYNKQNDAVRTPKVNTVFAAMPLLVKLSTENKNGRFNKNGQKSHWVVPTGIEPVSKV